MAGEVLLLLGEALTDAYVVLNVLLGAIDDGDVASACVCVCAICE